MPERRNFQQTLWDIQKRFGDQAVMTLAERGALRDAIPSGYPALDGLLGRGGIPRGQLSAIYGVPTCGATTLALHLLARAQGKDDAGLYLDLARTLDPDYAASFGVALDRLVIAQPEHAVQAVDIAREVARSGRAALIVVDLLNMAQRRHLSAAIERLRETTIGHQTAILFLLASPIAPLDEYAYTCLRLDRMDWLRDGRDVIGYQVRATVLKDKPQTSGRSTTLALTFDPRTEGDNG